MLCVSVAVNDHYLINFSRLNELITKLFKLEH